MPDSGAPPHWHGARLGEPGWLHPSERLLAMTLAGESADEADLHLVFDKSDRIVDLYFRGATVTVPTGTNSS
jgi:hypothetical protein